MYLCKSTCGAPKEFSSIGFPGSLFRGLPSDKFGFGRCAEKRIYEPEKFFQSVLNGNLSELFLLSAFRE